MHWPVLIAQACTHRVEGVPLSAEIILREKSDLTRCYFHSLSDQFNNFGCVNYRHMYICL